MNKLKLMALGAGVAAVVLVVRRRRSQAADEADLWAEATDYVTRTPKD